MSTKFQISSNSGQLYIHASLNIIIASVTLPTNLFKDSSTQTHAVNRTATAPQLFSLNEIFQVLYIEQRDHTLPQNGPKIITILGI